MKKYLILNILIFSSITSFWEEKKADMPELRNEMINILNTAPALTDEQDESGMYYAWNESEYQADNTKGWILTSST